MLYELEQINNKVIRLVQTESDQTGNNTQYYLGRFLYQNNFMFVGMRPTHGKSYHPRSNFDLKQDKRFIDLLSKYGFAGSYIVDIIKSCGHAGDHALDNRILSSYFDLLRQEIEIVNPDIIIALGDEAEEKLRSMVGNRKLEKIWHPAYVNRPDKRRPNKWKDYESQIVTLAKRYKQSKFPLCRGTV